MLLETSLPKQRVNPYACVIAGLIVAGLALVYGPLVITCETVVAGLASPLQGSTVNLALLGICSAAGLAVLAAIIHSVASFQAAESGSRFPIEAAREFVWALIPALIVIGAALPAVEPIVMGSQSKAVQTGGTLDRVCRPGGSLS